MTILYADTIHKIETNQILCGSRYTCDLTRNKNKRTIKENDGYYLPEMKFLLYLTSKRKYAKCVIVKPIQLMIKFYGRLCTHNYGFSFLYTYSFYFFDGSLMVYGYITHVIVVQQIISSYSIQNLAQV